MDWWYVALPAVLAAFAPVALIIVSNELRHTRLREVLDLEQSVFKGFGGDLPQLELAKARYSGQKHASGTDDDAALGGKLDSVRQYSGGLLYFLICLGGFALLFLPVRWILAGQQCGGTTLCAPLFWSPVPPIGAGCAEAIRTAAVTGFAFIGGYVFNAQYLIRQTLNQELGAQSFVRSAMRLLLGMGLAVMLYHAGAATNLTASVPAAGDVAYAAALAAAFMAGYLPDFALGKISAIARASQKGPDTEALEKAKNVPLEVIDGIDSVVSFRLQERNIYDVQNLAAANPIRLYAETPFSLMQAFDWVLQAQLCLMVGPKGFFRLKQHRIRTIFDLERAVLAKGAPQAYVRAILDLLFDDADPQFRATIGLPSAAAGAAPVAPLGPDQYMLIARHLTAILCDDAHVHRLRALWLAMIKNTSSTEAGGSGRMWLFEVGELPGDLPPPPPAQG